MLHCSQGCGLTSSPSNTDTAAITPAAGPERLDLSIVYIGDVYASSRFRHRPIIEKGFFPKLITVILIERGVPFVFESRRQFFVTLP